MCIVHLFKQRTSLNGNEKVYLWQGVRLKVFGVFVIFANRSSQSVCTCFTLRDGASTVVVGHFLLSPSLSAVRVHVRVDVGLNRHAVCIDVDAIDLVDGS